MDLLVGAIGIVLALVAIALTVAIEAIKRPRLDVRPSIFRPSGPLPWTFAAVEVVNDPTIPRAFRRFITRQSADGCEVWIEFRHAGEAGLALPRIPGRWSSQPEPIRRDPVIVPVVTTGAAAPDAPAGQGLQIVATFDPALAAASRRINVAASGAGEEVAVAVLRSDGRAFAWGADSYAHPGWEHPGWELQHGTYEVTVTARASGLLVRRRFELPFLSEDFAAFTLERLDI